MARHRNRTGRPEPAFEYPDWHHGPQCKVVLAWGGTGWWLWCEPCRCVANAEAVSIRLVVNSSGDVVLAETEPEVEVAE